MMAVYFATKAYVLHLSEALNQELREEGITVQRLPGATRTHFLEDSGMKAAVGEEREGSYPQVGS